MPKLTKKKNPKVVVIGGGTGVFTVLSGLREYPVDLTAVVSMADSGGSSGVLREEFGILPPGDVRRALVALASSDKKILSDLFNYRFSEGGLNGHAFGNVMLTALERVTGGFMNAVKEAGALLGVQGAVLPVTLNRVSLLAELKDGTIIRGETNIDIPKHNGAIAIDRVWLEPEAEIAPGVARALGAADLIVIGPGDLYTSVIPNLLVRGVPEAIRKARAKKAYVVNIMTKWGETYGFGAGDFVRAVESYLGKNVLDYAVVNTGRVSSERLSRYEEEHAALVRGGHLPGGIKTIQANLIRSRGFIRHDPAKLARVLVSLI